MLAIAWHLTMSLSPLQKRERARGELAVSNEPSGELSAGCDDWLIEKDDTKH